jgi:hypothetical protein
MHFEKFWREKFADRKVSKIFMPLLRFSDRLNFFLFFRAQRSVRPWSVSLFRGTLPLPERISSIEIEYVNGKIKITRHFSSEPHGCFLFCAKYDELVSFFSSLNQFVFIF